MYVRGNGVCVETVCAWRRYVYRVKLNFAASKHLEEKIFIDSYGNKVVRGCVHKVVKIGTSVDVGKDIKSPDRYVFNKEGRTWLVIYAST